jgi:hypothetical protein
MTMPFHVMPFEKRFLKKWFSPQISSKPQVLRRRSIEKNKKREKGKKAPRASLNKIGSQYSKRRKTLQLQKYPFWCDSIFSPSIIPFQKPFPKSLRKFS